MGALVAIRQRIRMAVVKQRVVSITPGKFLKGDISIKVRSITGNKQIFIHIFIGVIVNSERVGVCGCGQFETHLSADTQVRIWHKFWRLV